MNIFNCESKNLTNLPETVVKNTDWLLVAGNNLGDVLTVESYMPTITFLNMSSCKVRSISDDVIKVLVANLKFLDITKNNLKSLPRAIERATNVTELWISQNPYECNCDMIWMRDWLTGATTVMDKANVRCASGKLIGMI